MKPTVLNLEHFISFLERYARYEYDLNQYLKEVVQAAYEGKKHYELRSSESNTGNPEVIHFKVNNDNYTIEF